jgi:ATP-dependent RNA helicase RhlE
LTLFTDFGLAQPILKALAAEGYETPTPIQAQTIPYAMSGRDVCGIARQDGRLRAANPASPLGKPEAAPGQEPPCARAQPDP